MALSTLTSRVDERDKIAFDSFCNSVGLTASAAVNLFIKAVLREQRIPFEIRQSNPFAPVSADQILSDLAESREQIASGQGISMKDALEEMGHRHGFL